MSRPSSGFAKAPRGRELSSVLWDIAGCPGDLPDSLTCGIALSLDRVRQSGRRWGRTSSNTFGSHRLRNHGKSVLSFLDHGLPASDHLQLVLHVFVEASH